MEKFNYRGRELPARQTMGAYVIFKDTAGYDVTKVDQMDGVGMAVLLWASIKSACRVDGIEFADTFEEFADRVTPQQVAEWYTSADSGNPADAEAKKKSPTA